MGENLTLEAFKFMILGMSVVLLFLLTLIFLLNIQSKLIYKFFPPTKTDNFSKSLPISQDSVNKPQQEKVDEEIAAVIIAAVKKFRKKREL